MNSKKHFVVDCADIEAYEEVRNAYKVEGAPEALLSTHKHWDHAGHNQHFADTYPGIRIISGTNEPVYASNENLDDGASLNNLLNGSVTISAFETPCHTTGHCMFIMDVIDLSAEGVNKLIFTGDCLFEGGVGKFFEGNPEQMFTIFENLFNNRVPHFRESCVLFFGHDYGFMNYDWASNYLFAEREFPEMGDRTPSSLKKKVKERYEKLIH